MGCDASKESDMHTSNAFTVNRSHKSLIEFVRAATAKADTDDATVTIDDTVKSKASTVCDTTYDVIESVNELSHWQEEFLSRYKMRVNSYSDPVARQSVFDAIDNDFHEKYNKHVARSVLYDIFNIRA